MLCFVPVEDLLCIYFSMIIINFGIYFSLDISCLCFFLVWVKCKYV